MIKDNDEIKGKNRRSVTTHNVACTTGKTLVSDLLDTSVMVRTSQASSLDSSWNLLNSGLLHAFNLKPIGSRWIL